MARTVTAITLLVALLFTAGCAAIIVGAGAGAGVYTWVKGELIRSYAKDFTHTENATIQSLDYLKITIDEKNPDGQRNHHQGTPERRFPGERNDSDRALRHDRSGRQMWLCRLLGSEKRRTDPCHHPQHHLTRRSFWPRLNRRWPPII